MHTHYACKNVGCAKGKYMWYESRYDDECITIATDRACVCMWACISHWADATWEKRNRECWDFSGCFSSVLLFNRSRLQRRRRCVRWTCSSCGSSPMISHCPTVAAATNIHYKHINMSTVWIKTESHWLICSSSSHCVHSVIIALYTSYVFWTSQCCTHPDTRIRVVFFRYHTTSRGSNRRKAERSQHQQTEEKKSCRLWAAVWHRSNAAVIPLIYIVELNGMPL